MRALIGLIRASAGSIRLGDLRRRQRAGTLSGGQQQQLAIGLAKGFNIGTQGGGARQGRSSPPTIGRAPGYRKSSRALVTMYMAKPVLTIKPGDIVEVETLDAFGGSIKSEADIPSEKFSLPFANPQNRPIAVEGAEKGDAVAILIHSIVPRGPQPAGTTVLLASVPVREQSQDDELPAAPQGVRRQTQAGLSQARILVPLVLYHHVWRGAAIDPQTVHRATTQPRIGAPFTSSQAQSVLCLEHWPING